MPGHSTNNVDLEGQRLLAVNPTGLHWWNPMRIKGFREAGESAWGFAFAAAVKAKEHGLHRIALQAGGPALQAIGKNLMDPETGALTPVGNAFNVGGNALPGIVGIVVMVKAAKDIYDDPRNFRAYAHFASGAGMATSSGVVAYGNDNSVNPYGQNRWQGGGFAVQTVSTAAEMELQRRDDVEVARREAMYTHRNEATTHVNVLRGNEAPSSPASTSVTASSSPLTASAARSASPGSESTIPRHPGLHRIDSVATGVPQSVGNLRHRPTLPVQSPSRTPSPAPGAPRSR